MKIVISSGHGKYVRGASSQYGDEVDEARLVVEEVARVMRIAGHTVTTYHDDVSDDQSENLNRIVDFHNSKSRDMDVSVHFNAYDGNAHGTEVLYVTQDSLAKQICDAICNAAEFTNRGAKHRSDLAFLNGTTEPSVLIETCFIDSKNDMLTYDAKFYDICNAIASGITGEEIAPGPTPPERPERPPVGGPRPTLEEGSAGPYVVQLQNMLGIPADGEFGPATDAQVRGFQAACGLVSTGIVEDATWAELDTFWLRKRANDEGLTKDLIDEIEEIALDSPLNTYHWPDRGEPPPGYITGMALSFAVAMQWLENGSAVAELMARGATNTDTDALAWYEDEFRDLGIDVSVAGIDTLRALFVLLIGLGMRESSGDHWCGRDMSASNTTADTAEASLFQTSWNIRNGHSEIPPLLDYFWQNPNGFLPSFTEDLEPDSQDLSCYGSGDGAKYQWLSRYAPLFHTMVTAAGARVLRQHWGPINRREVTLNTDADLLLLKVQKLVNEEDFPVPVPPDPEDKVVTVEITVPDGVTVNVVMNDKGKRKRWRK